jgi:PilZ domain-containing protein
MFQRLYLTKPLKGRFGNRSVSLIDVSAAGALIADGDEIPIGERKNLRFTWRKKKVMIKAETVRTEEGRAGLRFLEDNKILRGLIAKSATEMLKAQQANMDGKREENIVGDETLTAASAGLLRGKGYMVYNLEQGVWTKRRAIIPEQPPNGFTVSAGEPEDQVALLCDAYQRGDEEARRMTRLLAELSVATVKP